MPSFTHEVILELFRNRPELAPLLLREALHAPLPDYTRAEIIDSTLIDERQAKADPELAVLSAMAHGRDADQDTAVRVGLAAQLASVGLDDDRAKMYLDLVFHSLTETARQALLNMDPAKYEYQSDFAKKYVAVGRAEGKAELVLRLVALRFGTVSESIQARIRAASPMELDSMGERVLTATTLEDVMN